MSKEIDIEKSKKDIIYFAENVLNISSLSDVQKEILRKITTGEEIKFNLYKKTRWRDVHNVLEKYFIHSGRKFMVATPIDNKAEALRGATPFTGELPFPIYSPELKEAIEKAKGELTK